MALPAYDPGSWIGTNVRVKMGFTSCRWSPFFLMWKGEESPTHGNQRIFSRTDPAMIL